MGHEDGSPGGYDAIETGDELVSWSRTYCRHAASQYDFDVDLHRVQWEVSTRAKRRAAAVKTPNVDDAEVGEPRRWTGTSSQSVELDIAPTCTMSLSWRAFESFDRGEWTATLRHELVHVEQFQAFGATDHGPAFKRRAEAVDAPVRVRRFAEPKYTLTCEACGADVAYRYRECKLVRESSAYRSACCEAPLDCRERQD